MIRRLLPFVAVILALAPQAHASLACVDVFGRTDSVQPEQIVPRANGRLAANRAFDAASFERVWNDMRSRYAGRKDILITPWSDQTSIEADILQVRLRTPGKNPLKVLITGGVHGNEPLGTLAVLDLVDVLARDPSIAGRALDITVMPALNYDGLTGNHRTNFGVDLNRSFDGVVNAKIAKVKAAIGRRKFDLSLDLHGSFERHQFFVIKQGDDGGLAAKAIESIPPNLRLKSDAGTDTGPVGLQTAHGYEKGRYNLEAAGLSTSVNVGTLKSYMASKGTRDAYTLEYPGQIDFTKARETFFNLALGFLKVSTGSSTNSNLRPAGK